MLAKPPDGFRIAEEGLEAAQLGDFFGQRQHGLPQLGIADLAADMRVLKGSSRPPRSCWRPIPAYPGGEYRTAAGRVRRPFAQHGDMFNRSPARGRRIT